MKEKSNLENHNKKFMGNISAVVPVVIHTLLLKDIVFLLA